MSLLQGASDLEWLQALKAEALRELWGMLPRKCLYLNTLKCQFQHCSPGILTAPGNTTPFNLEPSKKFRGRCALLPMYFILLVNEM